MESEFKRKLRAELDYHGLTVKELSAKTGIAKGTLDCYLGVRSSMPPADIAVKIANALGVSVEYLITGKDEKKDVPLKFYNQNIRTIMKIFPDLNEKDIETLLGLATVLKKQAEK